MQNFIYWFQKQAYLSLNGIRKTSKGMIFRLYDDQRFIYMQKRKMVKKPKYCKKIRVFHLKCKCRKDPNLIGLCFLRDLLFFVYNQACRRGAGGSMRPSCLSVGRAGGAKVPFLNAMICFSIVNMIQRR